MKDVKVKTEKKRRSGWMNALIGIAVILALILLAAAVFYIIPFTNQVDRAKLDGTADWMADLDGDLTLDAIVLPGTHDSATRYVQLGFFSKCQDLSIAEQLEAGYRYLDIRLGVNDGTLVLMHGFTFCRDGALPWSPKLTAERVLEQCYAFLKAHPDETVIFAVKQEHGKESVAEFEKLLDTLIQKHRSAWLLTDEIPTLDEARGKLVLMRRYDDAAGLGTDSGIPMLWADQGGSDDRTLHTASADNGSYVLWVQDRFEYEIEDKWRAFLDGMSEPGILEGEVAINFLSTKGSATYGHPWKYASILDQRLIGRDSAQLKGWIVIDFGSAGIARHIYLANFR